VSIIANNKHPGGVISRFNKINATIELNMAKPVVATFVNELNAKLAYYQNTVDISQGRRLAETKAKLQTEKN